ncbi:MAG: hypothetical protein H7X83_12825 [Verrucomicrobia bacterium]|nr:hypothetical protein [Deltaproteobacteria bacterium]
MVNLLFISNSAKIDTVRSALQPFFKVKIDIVADFDYGLKDVFEKRPAIVFIHDQIAGVTGESVARHIQMLLGAGAPSFIFMHESSPKAKPIKGLFEYLIDLSQTEVKIVADIQATLKSLLGDQWEKIYIPPKIDSAAIRDAVSVPEESRVFADQMVDDFLSDLDNFGSASAENKFHTTDFSVALPPADEPFQVVSSPQDQLAEMLSETNKDLFTAEVTTITAHDDSTKKPSVPAQVTVSARQDQQPVLPKRPETAAFVAAPVSAQPQPAPSEIVTAALLAPTLPDDGAVAPATRSATENPPLQQASPADFIIGGERPVEDVASEDLLRNFEGIYHSRSGGWKRYVTIAVVLTVCAGGGVWYLLKQKPHLLTDLSGPSAQPVVVAPAARPPEPVITVQKPLSPPARKTAVPLPAFIPQAGLDSSFASQKPGWERYVDTTMDYRVYRPVGKIKALQVLGLKNHDIGESRLKSILIELLGVGEYRVTSRGQKLGYHVSRATVGQKAELLIYRKNTTIRAFVVSLD